MEILKTLLDNLIPLLGLVLTTVIIYYVNRFFAGKVAQDKLDAIDRAVFIAVGAGEEAGHRALKVNKKPLTSAEKDGVAKAALNTEIKALGIPALDVERAKILLDSELNSNRPIAPPTHPAIPADTSVGTTEKK